MKNITLLVGMTLLVFTGTYGQKINSKNVDNWVNEVMVSAIREHRELVSIPNDAHFPEDMMKNAQWLKNAFEKRGFTVDLLETSTVPVVLATRNYDEKMPTVLFYIHFDGQPVDPSKWDQEDPFTPVVRDDKGVETPYSQIDNWNMDWRIYGRAAADDKGPIIMFLNAMDILNTKKIKPAYNIKVMLDGEEEMGSAGLKSTLSKYKDHYQADRLVIMDGPAHPTNKPTITFGCRGTASATLTVYGPISPQHSGHFGNYAPNPAFKMARLLASMKDDEGRTTIPGFYDAVKLNDETKQILNSVPDDESQITDRLGIAKSDAVGSSYQESLQYPSLNIKGMASGWIGKQTRTIIPDIATAQIGIRLVVETDGNELLNLVEDHIRKQGYYVIDREPTAEERAKYSSIASFRGSSSTAAFRTEMDSPLGKWLTNSLSKVYDESPVRIRTMGGTIPVTPIIEELNIPAVILPLVNMDNNQHSPNENLRVGNLYNGIKSCLGMLSEKFDN